MRTELNFGKNESAVIEPIPVTLDASTPVNVRVLHYDDTSLKILLNGKGKATLEMFVGTIYHDKRDKPFADGTVNPSAITLSFPYSVTIGGVNTPIKARGGLLSVPLNLDGQVEVVIEATE